MIIRKIDGANDWTFGKGLQNYASGEQAIEENVQTRLLSWVGDCFFALTEGIDWKARLDVGQKAALQQELKTMILQSFGVIGVNSINAVFGGDTRLFTVTFNIQTIFSSSFQSQVSQAAAP